MLSKISRASVTIQSIQLTDTIRPGIHRRVEKKPMRGDSCLDFYLFTVYQTCVSLRFVLNKLSGDDGI